MVFLDFHTSCSAIMAKADRKQYMITSLGTDPKISQTSKILEEITMANPFVHVELNTDNPSKSQQFYAQLFKWSFEETPSPVPGGKYTHIKVGEGTGGGLLKKPMAEAPTMWLPYVLVDSVDATLKKAADLGAKIVVQKMVVPDMGAFGIFIDPAGAALGVWEVARK